MAPPFVKLAANLYGNRKVMQAGRNGRDVFVFVLCQNAMNDGDGSVPLSDMEPWFLSHHLQCTEDEARDGFQRCVDAGLLIVTASRDVRDDVTPGRVQIAGWDDEWSRRPLTDAERAARYRERKKSSHESRDVRDESRDGHEGVTSHVGEERRREERERGEPAPSREVDTKKEASTALDLARREAALATRIWFDHCDRHEVLRSDLRLTDSVRPLRRMETAHGWKELRERIRGYQGAMDQAEADCAHVLAVREVEARAKPDQKLRYFGDVVWSEQQFTYALREPKPAAVAAKAMRDDRPFVHYWQAEDAS